MYPFPVYHYEPGSRVCITKSPMLRDPYEIRHVYVAPSHVPYAGEGLWAKTSIKKNQLVALFNGVRQRHLYYGTKTNQAWSDYRITCDSDVDLDILAQHVSVNNYSATLAHKTCHSFSPNSCFNQLYHPRFGLIMSVVASRDINQGEEIFVREDSE